MLSLILNGKAFHLKFELTACPWLWLERNAASKLFANLLANWKSHAITLLIKVLTVIIDKSFKGLERALLFLLGHAFALINDWNLDVNLIFL